MRGALSRRDLLASGGAVLAGAFGGNMQRLLAGSEATSGTSPGPSIGLGAEAAYATLLSHFWDPVGNHIRPTNGGAPAAKNGFVDYTRETPLPSFWQMESFENNIFNAAHYLGDESSRRRIADQWAYIQTVTRSDNGQLAFPPSVLAAKTAYRVTINLSDDAFWHCTYLMHVHMITGDPRALAYLADAIPNIAALFADPNTVGNPPKRYGTSPNLSNLDYGFGRDARGRYVGPVFAVGTYGMVYAQVGGFAYSTFGYISTLYEAALALCALYVADQLSLPGYELYARNTFRWLYQKLRTPPPADAWRKVEGIYETELILNPKGDFGAAESNRNAFLTARNAYFGKPIRGVDSTYIGGCFAMATLGARLFRVTGEEPYRLEAISIANAIIDPQGYGRDIGGKRIIQGCRDPWSNGHFVVPFADEVLSLPGAPSSCRQAIIDTAAYMLAHQIDGRGYISGDWAGPELDIVAHVMTWLDNFKRGAGNQASPAQIMTSAESLCVIQAGALLEQRWKRAP